MTESNNPTTNTEQEAEKEKNIPIVDEKENKKKTWKEFMDTITTKETDEDIRSKTAFNESGTFLLNKEQLNVELLENIYFHKEPNKPAKIVIDPEIVKNEGVGVNVTALHEQLSGKSYKSEFDVQIGDHSIKYAIDKKNIKADMSSMSKEVAASDDALKITLTDADKAKYGNVSIQIDPTNMKPVLVFTGPPELNETEMQAAKTDLAKIYGNDKSGAGKNAEMTIKGGDGTEIPFKDLNFMSQIELDGKKASVMEKIENSKNIGTPSFSVGTAGPSRNTTVELNKTKEDLKKNQAELVKAQETLKTLQTFKVVDDNGAINPELGALLKRFDVTNFDALLTKISELEAKVEKLTAEVGKLNALISTKDSEIQGLTDKLDEKEKALEKALNDLLKKFEIDLNGKDGQPKTIDELIRELDAKITEDKGASNQDKELIEQLQAQITDLKGQLDASQKENNALKEKLLEAQNALKETGVKINENGEIDQGSLDQTREMLKILEDKKISGVDGLSSLFNKIKNLENQVTEQNTKINELTENNQDLIQQNEELTQDLATANQKNGELTAENQDKNKTIEERDLKIQSQADEIARLTAALEKAQSASKNTASEKDAEIKKLKDDLKNKDDDLKKKDDDLKKKDDDLKKIKNALKIDGENVTPEQIIDKATENNAEINNLRQENQKLKTEIEGLKTKIEGLEKEKETLTNENGRLNVLVKENQKDILDLTEKNTKLTEANEAQTTQMKELTKGNREREEQLKADLTKEQGKNNDLSNKNEQLKTDLNEEKGKNKILEDKIKNMATDLANLNTKNSNLEKENKSMENAANQFKQLCPNQEKFVNFMEGMNGAITTANKNGDKKVAQALISLQTVYKNLGETQGYNLNDRSNDANKSNQNHRIKDSSGKIQNTPKHIQQQKQSQDNQKPTSTPPNSPNTRVTTGQGKQGGGRGVVH